MSELNFCDNKKFSKNKEFVKCEILIRKKYNYDMYLLDKLIEIAEGKNKEHTFENLNKKAIKSYKMFLILRKFMVMFNDNQSDFIKKNKNNSPYRRKSIINKINMNHPTQKNNTKLKKYEN